MPNGRLNCARAFCPPLVENPTPYLSPLICAALIMMIGIFALLVTVAVKREQEPDLGKYSAKFLGIALGCAIAGGLLLYLTIGIINACRQVFASRQPEWVPPVLLP